MSVVKSGKTVVIVYNAWEVVRTIKCDFQGKMADTFLAVHPSILSLWQITIPSNLREIAPNEFDTAEYG